jgi:hypothetical protein
MPRSTIKVCGWIKLYPALFYFNHQLSFDGSKDEVVREPSRPPARAARGVSVSAPSFRQRAPQPDETHVRCSRRVSACGPLPAMRSGCRAARSVCPRARASPVNQIDRPTSPSRTDVFSRGRSPLFQSAAVCNTRYLIGPPSGRSLRVMGRGTQTNSVRISSADNRTFA